jgi:hypothetical protein
VISALHIGVLACGVWALGLLGALHRRAKGYGHRDLFARPAGDPRKGVAYAFGKGMSPAAKESAREHLPTWFAGVGYHLGIFAGLLYLALLLIGVEPEGVLLRVLQVPLLAGAFCGTGLLAKRVLTPRLRGLSCPDDFLSNVLTTVFVALAFARTMTLHLDAVLLTETMLLFLWVPLGKIRHCLFFFTTRYYMGTHFGRRGTFPPGGFPSGALPRGMTSPGTTPPATFPPRA